MCIRDRPETVVLGAFHIVVIEDEAGEAAVFGQDLGLRRDGLCGEDAVHRGQQRISIEQFAVASQLLDAINAAVTFDFHSHMLALGIHGHNIHWANGGRVFATHQLGSLADTLDLLGQIALQMVFHAILDETRIFAQIIGLVGIDMLQRHFKNVRTLVGADT